MRPTVRAHLSAVCRSPLGTVVAEGFGSRLAFGIVSFALPLYAHGLGMSLTTIGLLLSTNLAVAVALKPFVGPVVDRIGVRRAYLVAVALRTVTVLLLVLTAAPWQLFAVRALHGVSIAVRDPAAASVLAGLGGSGAVARRFAWYQTAKTVAGAAGRFAAGVLLTLLAGYDGAFLVAGAVSVAPLVLVLLRLRGPALDGLRPLPRPEVPAADAGEWAAPAPAPVTWRRLAPLAGLGYLSAGTAYLLTNLLPVLAVEYAGVSPAAAGSVYAVTAVVGLSGPVWGRLFDRGNRRLVLGTRAAGNLVSSVVWLVFPTYAGLVLGKAADDVGKAAFRPAWGALGAQLAETDPRRRATTLARLSSAEDLGEMTGPVVAGMVWSAFGLPAVLVLRIALAVLTEVGTVLVGRRLPQPTPAPVSGGTPPGRTR